MRRISHLYNEVISLENLRLADHKARMGKRYTIGVKLHDLARDSNILTLHETLKNNQFRTSKYHTFIIHSPKERVIHRLPYFPDRIVHHAILNILEPVWNSVFTADTYACIKYRGIHGALRAVKHGLADVENTQYCLKLDIRKFYPSINHDILKQILARKIKDTELLQLLYEIIDSAPGIPIGNFTSQYFANLYLAYFDHWIKEEKQIKYYYRYADDLVFLAPEKEELHLLFADIKQYMSEKLQLEIKGNYQVFPVAARGIDFVGYRFYHTHTLLRKSIKQRFARAVARRGNSVQVHAAYWGWAKHCDSINLLKKLNMKLFSELNVPAPIGSFAGEKIKIAKIMNREIAVLDSRIDESKYPKNKSGKVLMLQLEVDGEKRILFTGSDVLIAQIQHIKKEDYPFKVTIIKEGEHFEFK
jgi:RNA-directed DNA polymerase